MVGVGLGVWVAVGRGVIVCVGVDVEVAVATGTQDDRRKAMSKNVLRFFMTISYPFFILRLPILAHVTASGWCGLTSGLTERITPDGRPKIRKN